jgi:hypothetical protein
MHLLTGTFQKLDSAAAGADEKPAPAPHATLLVPVVVRLVRAFDGDT